MEIDDPIRVIQNVFLIVRTMFEHKRDYKMILLFEEYFRRIDFVHLVDVKN